MRGLLDMHERCSLHAFFSILRTMELVAPLQVIQVHASYATLWDRLSRDYVYVCGSPNAYEVLCILPFFPRTCRCITESRREQVVGIQSSRQSPWVQTLGRTTLRVEYWNIAYDVAVGCMQGWRKGVADGTGLTVM